MRKILNKKEMIFCYFFVETGNPKEVKNANYYLLMLLISHFHYIDFRNTVKQESPPGLPD